MTQRDQSDWDEVPKAFNEWWDKDYDGQGNPFSFDSPAYWAWAGWKAAAPHGEPVAWRVWRGDAYELFFQRDAAVRRSCCFIKQPEVEPLYTHPAPAPLSDESAERIRDLEKMVAALQLFIKETSKFSVTPAPLSDEYTFEIAAWRVSFNNGETWTLWETDPQESPGMIVQPLLIRVPL